MMPTYMNFMLFLAAVPLAVASSIAHSEPDNVAAAMASAAVEADGSVLVRKQEELPHKTEESHRGSLEHMVVGAGGVLDGHAVDDITKAGGALVDDGSMDRHGFIAGETNGNESAEPMSTMQTVLYLCVSPILALIVVACVSCICGVKRKEDKLPRRSSRKTDTPPGLSPRSKEDAENPANRSKEDDENPADAQEVTRSKSDFADNFDGHNMQANPGNRRVSAFGGDFVTPHLERQNTVHTMNTAAANPSSFAADLHNTHVGGVVHKESAPKPRSGGTLKRSSVAHADDTSDED